MSTEALEQSSAVAAAPLGKDSFAMIAAENMSVANATEPADLGWRGRKVCSVMKVVSAIMCGVATSPGGDAPVEAIVAATKDLLARATELADAALPLVGLAEGDPDFASIRNVLRQNAAETIAMQWRLAHTTGLKTLSVEKITEIYRSVKESEFLAEITTDGESATARDVVTAKRLAMISVVAEVHNAVAAFDYYHPKPEILTEAGVTAVVEGASRGIERILAGGSHSSEVHAAVAQVFISRAGQLYAQNYRAFANRDIRGLEEMTPDERLCRIRECRTSGMATSHIDEAYRRLLDRMVDMVIEAAPELSAQPHGAGAPSYEAPTDGQ